MKPLFILLTAWLFAPLAVFSADGARHALVMGVWDYASTSFPSLNGPERDVLEMADKLRHLGFETKVVANPDLPQAKRAVDAFGAVLESKGGTALFYFSGYGCGYQGENYLIPSDVSLKRTADLNIEALPLGRVLDRMENSGTQTNLVFLDCARSDSMRSQGAGLLETAYAPNTFIGFASRDAMPISDRSLIQRGGYTEALLRHLGRPGLSITDAHALIQREVSLLDGEKRWVFQQSRLNHPFFMVPAGSMSPPTTSLPPQVPDTDMELRLRQEREMRARMEQEMQLAEARRRQEEEQTRMAALKPNPEEVEGELDRQMQKLKSGTVAFNTPETMTIEEVNLIHLVLSPKANDASIQEQVTGEGPVAVMSARYSHVVEARLTGEAFQIEAATETRQPVSAVEPTEWRWQVIPRLPGAHQLYLSLYAVVIIEGEKHERLLKTFERKLNVTVSFSKHPVAFLKHHPEWTLAGTGLVFISVAAALIYLRLGRRVKASGGSWRTVTQPLKVDVFVSYSSKDRSWVLEFVNALRSRSVTVWMDQGGIAPAAFWAEQISQALSGAKVVVLVGSRHAFASHNVAKEISLASAQQKTVLPFILDKSEVPDLLAYQLAGIQLTHINPGDLTAAVHMVMALPALQAKNGSAPSDKESS